jgi:hypothetical protein
MTDIIARSEREGSQAFQPHRRQGSSVAGAGMRCASALSIPGRLCLRMASVGCKAPFGVVLTSYLQEGSYDEGRMAVEI